MHGTLFGRRPTNSVIANQTLSANTAGNYCMEEQRIFDQRANNSVATYHAFVGVYVVFWHLHCILCCCRM